MTAIVLLAFAALAQAPQSTQAPAPATPAPTAAPSSTSPADQPSQKPAETPPQPSPPPRPRFLIVLDPAHGGDDAGAALSDRLREKDVTLALARRVRAELSATGITAVLARDSDVALSPEQRAQLANTSRAAIFVSIHAAPSGHGLRFSTALLPGLEGRSGSWTPWSRAQAAYLDTSHAVAETLAQQARERKMPVVVLGSPLEPLNHVTSAALAVEVAPPPQQQVSALAAGTYQQQVAATLAAGLGAARRRLADAGAAGTR